MIAVASRPYWTVMIFAASSTWNTVSSLFSSAYAPPLGICSSVRHGRITLARQLTLSLSMYNSTNSNGETLARTSLATSRAIRSMPPLVNNNKQKVRPKKRKLHKNKNSERIVIEGFEKESEDEEGFPLITSCQSQKEESSLQTQYLKHLDRHLVLVLNADYQVRLFVSGVRYLTRFLFNRKTLPLTFCRLVYISLIAATQSCATESLDLARCSQGDFFLLHLKLVILLIASTLWTWLLVPSFII